MKPYFAKYLPVEGRVKQGDKFLINDDHPQGRLRTAYRITTGNRLWNGQDWDTLIGEHYFIDPTPKEGSGFVTELECKKASLFLCSRDIRAGDELYYPDGKGPEIADDTEKHKAWVKQYGLFKVIGEISPNAKWVKEGDEFDYNEVKIWYSCEKMSECDLNFGDQICSAPHQILEDVNIKCPCCETFK